MGELVKAVTAYKAIDHYVTSADARLAARSNQDKLDYLQKRDESIRSQNESFMSMQFNDAYEERFVHQEELRKQRDHEEWEGKLNRLHELSMQLEEHTMRREELESQEKIASKSLKTQKEIALLAAHAAMRNSDLDREARLTMQARELDHDEQIELRKLRVQEKISKQQEELQKYLFEQGIKNTQELERFKALAVRETQILVARENAQNMLQDKMVQEALKTFPLNISPIVLLKNRSHSLTGLLRFSTHLPQSVLPPVTQVYNDVKNYSANPEALNVFIAPIYIDSKIQNRENLSQQIWDSIYTKVEGFFTNHYNRRSDHPVILYPTAWKDKASAGQHASETLHFFLKDIPCLVLEPKFDGHSFSIMLSAWGLGYSSTDHVRSEINFKLDLDALLIKSAYERSKKSLALLDQLGDKIDELLETKRNQLLQNVNFYETLKLDERIASGELEEINALGVFNLFHIDPVQDMAPATETISSLICLNLAILSDVHHLQGTDVSPLLPDLFQKHFPELFNDEELRQMVAKCYERVYIFLRNADTMVTDGINKRDMERVREMQITNLNKTLNLINDEELNNTVEDKLRKYAAEQFNIHTDDIDELYQKAVDSMTVNDIPFFKELLPNVPTRRRYKQIDKRISDLQNGL